MLPSTVIVVRIGIVREREGDSAGRGIFAANDPTIIIDQPSTPPEKKRSMREREREAHRKQTTLQLQTAEAGPRPRCHDISLPTILINAWLLVKSSRSDNSNDTTINSEEQQIFKGVIRGGKLN